MLMTIWTRKKIMSMAMENLDKCFNEKEILNKKLQRFTIN